MKVVSKHKMIGSRRRKIFPMFLTRLKYPGAWKFAKNTKRAIKKSMAGFGQEARETRAMARSFYNMLENKLDLHNRTVPPTPEEVKEAIEQLKDIGRISVFATISILPGGGFSLIGLELMARKFGIRNFTFIPSAFRKKPVSDGNDSETKEEVNKAGTIHKQKSE